MYVYGQNVVKFLNSLLEKVHRALECLEPLGDSAEVEYRNPLKKWDIQLKYEQLRSLKICAKCSSAVFRVDESSDNLYPEV